VEQLLHLPDNKGSGNSELSRVKNPLSSIYAKTFSHFSLIISIFAQKFNQPTITYLLYAPHIYYCTHNNNNIMKLNQPMKIKVPSKCLHITNLKTKTINYDNDEWPFGLC